mmetsp:Transcript_253/g.409  ORF Transcript_253/g.409 Transcript_253/m.409 type:complete len:203 (-) Transcript_253:473-1081(-)
MFDELRAKVLLLFREDWCGELRPLLRSGSSAQLSGFHATCDSRSRGGGDPDSVPEVRRRAGSRDSATETKRRKPKLLLQGSTSLPTLWTQRGHLLRCGRCETCGRGCSFPGSATNLSFDRYRRTCRRLQRGRLFFPRPRRRWKNSPAPYRGRGSSNAADTGGSPARSPRPALGRAFPCRRALAAVSSSSQGPRGASSRGCTF